MTVTPETTRQRVLNTPEAGGGERAWRLPADDLARRAMRVPWLWPALATLFLGCYQVDNAVLWRDELWSWSFAAKPAGQLISTAGGSNPAGVPYYLLLHYWISVFGDSVAAMRMLSVLAMTIAAALVTLAGRRLAGARAGLLAGLVFALVPSVSRFAQEVRFYAPEMLAASLATLLLLRALDEPLPRRWAVYALSLAAVGYLDIVALSLLAGHAAAVALRWQATRNNRLLLFAAAAAAGLAACLPLAAVSWGKSAGQVGWIPRPGFDMYVLSFFARNLYYSTSVAAGVLVLALLGWTARRPAAFATAIAVAPVASVWLLSQGANSYFFPRYLLFTVAAWAILAGIGLSRLDVRLAAVAVLVIAMFGAGDQRIIREAGAHDCASYPVGSCDGYYLDYAAAARIVADGVRSGDGIIYSTRRDNWEMIGPGVRYYLRHYLPVREPLPQQLATSSALGAAHRLWIVASRRWRNPYRMFNTRQVAALRQQYQQSRARYVPGLTVFLMVREH